MFYSQDMARKKKPEKPNRPGKWSKESMGAAIHSVKDGKVSLRMAAKRHGVSRSTLERRIKGNLFIALNFFFIYCQTRTI